MQIIIICNLAWNQKIKSLNFIIDRIIIFYFLGIFIPKRLDRVNRGDARAYPRAGTASLLDELFSDQPSEPINSTSVEQGIWVQALIETVIQSDRELRRVTVNEVLADCKLDPATLARAGAR